MTKQEAEQYEALLIWVKALDVATEAAQARIKATLTSSSADVREERKAGRGEWVAPRF